MSEDEEHWGGYQKDRLDKAAAANDDDDDIWLMNDRVTFALDGAGHLDEDDDDGEDSDCDGAVGDERGKGKDRDGDDDDDGEVTWEHDRGPRGRTKFDEYYDARRAKNKKRKEGLGKGDRF